MSLALTQVTPDRDSELSRQTHLGFTIRSLRANDAHLHFWLFWWIVNLLLENKSIVEKINLFSKTCTLELLDKQIVQNHQLINQFICPLHFQTQLWPVNNTMYKNKRGPRPALTADPCLCWRCQWVCGVQLKAPGPRALQLSPWPPTDCPGSVLYLTGTSESQQRDMSPTHSYFT